MTVDTIAVLHALAQRELLVYADNLKRGCYDTDSDRKMQVLDIMSALEDAIDELEDAVDELEDAVDEFTGLK